MDHYTDDDLITYATDPSDVPNREEMEGHLGGCPDCRTRLSELTRVEEELRDPAVWRQVDGLLARPSRLEETLKLKAAIEKENADAVRMVTPLLVSPVRFDDARIAENARFHTAGVVRMLCAEANGMHEKRPKFSLRLADAACAIAAILAADRPSARYCHGLALRERANALRYLGRFSEALKALDEAEPFFDTSPAGDPLSRAIVGYIRGSVLIQIERAAEALPIARSVIEIFRDYGDERRELSALLLEGASLHTLGEHEQAVHVFEQVVALARRLDDRQHLAYALQAAAITSVDLRALDRAEAYYAEALVLYDELGVATEKVRIEWALGGVAMARGDLETAERLLHAACSELQRAGLRNDHALATLEWVEVRLALNRSEGVVKACREILVQFQTEAMTRNARLALAHLHQALGKQIATPRLARQIRTYLRDLPRHPAQAFVPHS